MTQPPDRPTTAALYSVPAGPEEGPAVVLVHGFTQTHVSWAPVQGDLARDHRVTVVDAPGHGGSTTIRSGLAEGAQLLGAAGGPAIYVGYSMGGRLALRLALDRPDLVQGLVLLGATAGIADPAERATRRTSDEALAAKIEAEGVSTFVDRWLAQPLFAGLAVTSADLAARRANTAAGLASSLRLAGTATMDPPWWDELPGLVVPTLTLAGEHDEKFTEIGHRLVQGIGPASSFESMAGASHAAHLQYPVAFAARVRDFVTSLSSPS